MDGVRRAEVRPAMAPGPVMEISTLREASAAVVTYSVADPSSANDILQAFLISVH